MNANNFFSKIYFKVKSFIGKLQIISYKLQGMIIGEKTVLGKINVEWPGSIEIGRNCDVQSGVTFWVQSPFKKENKIVIGDNVFIGRNTEFNCCKYIKVGSNCLIASSTVFVDSSHTYGKNEPISTQPITLKEIIIGEDVWIGTGCKILLGVTLGIGCIVGAGAVVNKSVPAYEIWAGVPAKKIGERKSV